MWTTQKSQCSINRYIFFLVCECVHLSRDKLIVFFKLTFFFLPFNFIYMDAIAQFSAFFPIFTLTLWAKIQQKIAFHQCIHKLFCRKISALLWTKKKYHRTGFVWTESVFIHIHFKNLLTYKKPLGSYKKKFKIKNPNLTQCGFCYACGNIGWESAKKVHRKTITIKMNINFFKYIDNFFIHSGNGCKAIRFGNGWKN